MAKQKDSPSKTMNLVAIEKLKALSKHWAAGTEWEPEFKVGGFGRVDIGCTIDSNDTKSVVIIELERRRVGAATNVIKIIEWLENDEQSPRKLLYIQAFSLYYDGAKRSRVEVQALPAPTDPSKCEPAKAKRQALLVGKILAKSFSGRVSYRAWDFPYRPEQDAQHGGGAMKKHTRELMEKLFKEEIRPFIDKSLSKR